MDPHERLKSSWVQGGARMTAPTMPSLEVSRPALALVEKVGYGQPSVSFGTFQEVAERPRTTVTRHLKQLTENRLLLRVRRGEYAIPDRSTFGRLLVEPSRYRRSVYLYAETLEARGEEPWAFACLPVRSAYPMDLDRAIPVLHPDDRLKDSTRSRPYAEALWFAFDAGALDVHGVEDDEGELVMEVPTLPAGLSLSLLMASLDPRYMDAARAAAERLELSPEAIARQAKHLSPASPPLTAIRPNTVVFPEWLEAFWGTAKTQHARHALDEFLPGGEQGFPEDPVGADA